jgi:YHS domain-containing protein
MATDPVCGMQVDERTAKYKSVYMGQAYYFCSPGCKASFDKDPQKYAVKTGASELQYHHVAG